MACCPALRVLLRRPGESGQEARSESHGIHGSRHHATERNELDELPLVDTTKIYKSVEFEIGSDRGSAIQGSGLGNRTGRGGYKERVENWQTMEGKGAV